MHVWRTRLRIEMASVASGKSNCIAGIRVSDPSLHNTEGRSREALQNLPVSVPLAVAAVFAPSGVL